jgi:hypothetical protein
MSKCDTCASRNTCGIPVKNPNVHVNDCGYYITQKEGEKRKSEAFKG